MREEQGRHAVTLQLQGEGTEGDGESATPCEVGTHSEQLGWQAADGRALQERVRSPKGQNKQAEGFGQDVRQGQRELSEGL